jgi:hypothetical protein
MIPGLTFERFFDGIFEVDDHRIGASRQGFGEAFGSTARHEQCGADGGWGHVKRS